MDQANVQCREQQKHQLLTLFWMWSLFLFAAALLCSTVRAEEKLETVQTPRFTLHINHDDSYERTTPIPIHEIREHSLQILDSTYDEFGRVLGVSPEEKVVLRFLSPREFRAETGAPSWTNAMYFRGEITLPLSPSTNTQLPELKKALRHEYVHALVAEVSKGRCPAWFDEGLAQLMEGGQPNSLLGPALRKWIRENSAMPLTWLQDGFLGLNSNLVPAAYAQSLFATRSLANSNGMSAIKNYLTLLGSGMAQDQAFSQAFNKPLTSFEAELTDQIQRWSQTAQIHP